VAVRNADKLKVSRVRLQIRAMIQKHQDQMSNSRQKIKVLRVQLASLRSK